MKLNQRGSADMIVFGFLIAVLVIGGIVAVLFVDSGSTNVASSSDAETSEEEPSTQETTRTESFSAELTTQSSTWSQEVYDNFVNGCMETAVTPTSGIDRETGLIYCTCAANGVEDLYPTDEILIREEQDWARNGLPADVDQVTDECLALAGLI